MSETQEILETVAKAKTTSRRRFLAQAGMAGVATVGLGTLGAGEAGAQASLQGRRKGRFGGRKINDVDILNFALNLEYLEAEFYLRAVFGRGLADGDTTGVGTRGEVTGGRPVPFQVAALRSAAEEIAADEEAHVKLLRSALGRNAIARPALNISTELFTALARQAGFVSGNGRFDPYENDNDFLLGAFVFEDVGVTAYKGAAPFIKNANILETAAGVLAVEAYHAGALRTTILLAGTVGIGGVQPQPSFITESQAISNLRDSADGPDDRDQGVTAGAAVNITPTDANAVAFSRSFAQILGIVYLGGAVGTGGGFFPAGANGKIR